MTPDEIRAEAIERLARSLYGMQVTRMVPPPWEAQSDNLRRPYLRRASMLVDALGDMLPTGEVWGCRYRGWALAVDAFDDESQARQHVATRPQDELVRTWSHEWTEVTG